MKKTPEETFIFFPVTAFLWIFRNTLFLSERKKATLSAEKHKEQAMADAISYLEDHFDDLDEDDIVDYMWKPNNTLYRDIDGAIESASLINGGYLPFDILIEKKGESFYFTVYAEADDLEFEVVVDTTQNLNTYDMRADNLVRRDAFMKHMQLYKSISDQCEKITLGGHWCDDGCKTYEDNPQNNYDLMMKDLYMHLSRVEKIWSPFDFSESAYFNGYDNCFVINFYVDENALVYCKANVDFLTYLITEYTLMSDVRCGDLKRDVDFCINIRTKDGCNICLSPRHDEELVFNTPQISDEPTGGYVWDEGVSDFVKRDEYISFQSVTGKPSFYMSFNMESFTFEEDC